MLTNDVIEYVHEFDKIHKQINELFIDKSDIEYAIKNLINYDPDDSYIIGFSIVETPYGNECDDGTFVDEHCSDSLFIPDGGYGTQYFPIENGQWLAVEYQW